MSDLTEKFCEHAVEYIENVDCLITSFEYHVKALYEESTFIMPDVLKAQKLLESEETRKGSTTKPRLDEVASRLQDVLNTLRPLCTDAHILRIKSEQTYDEAVKDAGLEELQ